MKAILPVVALVNILAASPALAAFTLANNNGGDGYVVVDPLDDRIFTLFGANNSVDLAGLDNLTTYGTVATTARVYDVRWSHVTEDSSANWDPGGWFLNADFIPLTDDAVTTGVIQGGRFQITVNPGDQWGFYVYTTEGDFGRGALSVSMVPEPASWALLIAGFGLTGAALRRRRSLAA
ncbi:MAG: PEP-CTERM sorting domain-containing protein [Alphaproteobacteria bacterium]|nr:PEP-CTERM sorting domain-containing protein [Alphaproteobacteria bacterium]